jgi:hypothetical protein
MKKFKIFLTGLFILSLISSAIILPQQKRGDSNEIKEAIMKGNSITSAVFNYGSIGKPNYLSGVADLVWKKLGYMFEFGPMMAAQVVGQDSSGYNIVSDSYILPAQGGYSPEGTVKWGWLPRAGYANPNQTKIATARNSASWPSDWSQWPGEFGAGQIVSQDEAYYVMDDFSNAEFPYYPFPNDTTKRGLGVKVEVRVYQFGGELKNSLILKYKITNESSKTLNNAYFGFMGDPHIGGASDYSDDLVNVIAPHTPYAAPLWNSVYEWDNDNKGMGGLTPGVLSLQLLETPDDMGMTSFHTVAYTNSLPNVPKNRPLMWQWFTGGIDTTSSILKTPTDNIVHFGTGPFTLKPGETKNLELAINLSDNIETMKKQLSYVYYVHNWASANYQEGSEGGNANYKIKLSTPNGVVMNGSVPILWNYAGSDQNAKVFIEYSSDKGVNWTPITYEQPVAAQFVWNTVGLNDGVNYIVRIVAYNPNDKSQYYYSINQNKFTINNAVNAKPEIEFTSKLDSLTLKTSPFNLSWISEDADDTVLTASLAYSTNINGPFTPIIDNKKLAYGAYSYNWDFTNLPNYSGYYLKLTVSDGNTDTTIITPQFSINQQAGVYAKNIFKQTNGIATPDLELVVVNASELTGSSYELSFTESGSNKIINIKNLTSGKTVVTNEVLTSGMSTSYFEGLKLNISDKTTDINYDKTKFNRYELNALVNVATAVLGVPQKAAEDWAIVFNDLDTLANGQYKFPGDTVKNNLTKSVVCPFQIMNFPSAQKANYLIYESVSGAKNNVRWDSGEAITLRPQAAAGNATCYAVTLKFTSALKPGKGDTLNIITYKSITSSDVFRFTAGKNYVTGVKDKITANEYKLMQNYPNPFNPSTIISYKLASPGKVSLKIYDILGKEVATLVNGEQQAGAHQAVFNAQNYGLSSGMYFYKLDAGNYHKVSKMLLIK